METTINMMNQNTTINGDVNVTAQLNLMNNDDLEKLLSTTFKADSRRLAHHLSGFGADIGNMATSMMADAILTKKTEAPNIEVIVRVNECEVVSATLTYPDNASDATTEEREYNRIELIREAIELDLMNEIVVPLAYPVLLAISNN